MNVRPACILASMLSVAFVGAGASVAAPAYASAPPKVKATLVGLGQQDLLSRRRVTVRLQVSRKSVVRVAVGLVSGARTENASARTLWLRSGPARAVDFPLSDAARAVIGGCASPRVDVVVAPRAHKAHVLHLSEPVVLEPPRCGQFFGPQSVWNAPLAADAPLDPGSGAVISALTAEVRREFQNGTPPNINSSSYSAPIYTVARGQRTVTVQLDQPPGSAPELARRFEAVPIPDGARPAQGTDQQMVIWQPSNDALWEFWRMHRVGDAWHAVWGGVLDGVSRGPGYFAPPAGGWGATATGLPLAGGLITAAELSRGDIPHALAMAVPGPRAGLYASPAQRTDGTSYASSAVPEGARLRLDPSLDLGALKLSAPILAMATAAQHYGILIRDQAANVAFYAEDPAPLGHDPYPQILGASAQDLLRTFPWAHLQLVRMDLHGRGPTFGAGPIMCLLSCPF